MIDPTVRPASTDDAAQLRWTEGEARRALRGQRGGDRWLATNDPVDLDWERVVESGGVFVAHIGDVVVGYVRATVSDGLATIDDVFVLEDARELGFGDELLGAAIAHARGAGARILEGEALPGDRDTKNLYERAGIKARLITVSTEL
jgi:GNAT superfamily N-acetyltransferase